MNTERSAGGAQLDVRIPDRLFVSNDSFARGKLLLRRDDWRHSGQGVDSELA